MPSSWACLMSGLTCTVDHVSANKQINTSTMCGFKRSDQRSASNIALIKEAIIDHLQAQKPSTIGHGSLSEISFPLSQYAIVYIYNRICIRIFDLPNCPAALSLESSTCRTPQRLFRLRSCGFQSLGVPLPCPLGVPALSEGQGPTHGLRSHWFRLFTKGKEGCTASTPTGSGSL